ncbi:GTP cyclohydrolase II [Coemansia sp. RSA 1250]|nr:GTP cyclohydrolase II [Coemansia sp. RSA 1250]
MPSTAPTDLDAATVVPPTPDERMPMTPIPKPTSVKAHFNASLDVALQLLQKQSNQEKPNGVDSASSLNWASAETTKDLPRPRTKNFPELYAAMPDDLITASAADTPFLDTPTCCNSRASSTSISEQQQKSNDTFDGVKAQKDQKEAADTQATCQVRARIPYPGGHFYLHVYHTDEDDKEHLAIVFGDDIRSATLEAPRDGETDMDRKIRGASTGALQRLVANDIAGRAIESDKSDLQSSLPMLHNFEPDPAEMFAASRLSVVDAPLVRIHSECFTGETVSSVRCDCGYQLAEAMRLIQQEGRGVIVYLRQEGRGIGLLEKLKAYNLQDMGHDTVDANLMLNHPADARTYGAARAILGDLGISKLRLLTNNKDKISQLQGNNAFSRLDIVCHVPMYPRWWQKEGVEAAQLSYSRHLALKRDVMSEADRYLRTKAERMGHMLSFEESLAPSIVIPRAPTSALFTQKI